MIADLLRRTADASLEATTIGSFTRIGPAARRGRFPEVGHDLVAQLGHGREEGFDLVAVLLQVEFEELQPHQHFGVVAPPFPRAPFDGFPTTLEPG